MVGYLERVGPVDGGDGEDGVVGTQIACPVGRLGPAPGILAGEVVDVDHPQPDPTALVKVVDGGLHLDALALGQHSGLVGDVIRQPERRIGHRPGRHENSRGKTGEDDAE